jgi:hypothetical protein
VAGRQSSPNFQPANFMKVVRVVGVMTRKLLILTTALAGMAATPAAASATTDGTSNTIMFAELRHVPPGFMDYTDDVCMLRATKGGER